MIKNTSSRPGRPPSGLTPHPVKLYCSDEQWAAYNAERDGMTWSEYIAKLKEDAERGRKFARNLWSDDFQALVDEALESTKESGK